LSAATSADIRCLDVPAFKETIELLSALYLPAWSTEDSAAQAPLVCCTSCEEFVAQLEQYYPALVATMKAQLQRVCIVEE